MLLTENLISILQAGIPPALYEGDRPTHCPYILPRINTYDNEVIFSNKIVVLVSSESIVVSP